MKKITVFFFSQTMAQSDTTISKVRDVEIIHADKLQFYTDDEGNPIRKMVGNVQLKQDSTFMFCDSAFLKKEKKPNVIFLK